MEGSLMRRSTARRRLPLLILVAIAVLATGCARVANPQGWAGPSVTDGTLYASIEKGRMAALDPDDLSVIWVFPPDTEEGNKLELESIYAAPVVDGDTLYFGAYDGNIYALTARDGTPLWRFETGDPIVGALTLNDGTLYAASTNGLLYAIDTSQCTNACPATAAKTYDTGSSIWASPLLVDDTIYLADMEGRLQAINALTLERIDGFAFQTNAGLLMDPTLASDDRLLVAGIDGKLYALDPETGAEVWNEPVSGGNWFWGKPLVDGDTVFIGDLDGKVHAVQLSDGASRWADTFSAEGPVRSAPLLVDDTLIIVDRGGNAYGLNPDDGSPLWGPTLLDKAVLSDPLLLESGPEPDPVESPSPSPDAASPGPTPAATTDARFGEAVVLIVAEGGDLCAIDPSDGSPVGALLCEEIPL
jgi:outer membrane protein assembly factor BamB